MKNDKVFKRINREKGRDREKEGEVGEWRISLI